jgi:hypothetical protein
MDTRLTTEISELATTFSAIWGHAITPMIDIVWYPNSTLL